MRMKNGEQAPVSVQSKVIFFDYWVELSAKLDNSVDILKLAKAIGFSACTGATTGAVTLALALIA
jgi:hypothetical protein